MQARAAEDLQRLVTEKLAAAGMNFTSARAFVTPRRLALVVDGLPERQPDRTEERKGPRVGSPEQAIQGFLKSAGLTSLDQCEKRMIGKAEFYFAISRKAGLDTKKVLPELIWEILMDLGWPKSMRWAENKFRWVRPLHRIIAIFDGNVLDGALELGLGSPTPTVGRFATRSMAEANAKKTPQNFIAYSDLTAGHRFLAPKEFSVTGFADYQTKLRAAKVVLDREERKRIIVDQAQALAKKQGLTLKPDAGLIEEVAGLVEWPVALIGRIDAAYLGLPPEVLTTSMRTHQKYCALETADGKLAPQFIVIANTEANDGGKAIIAGNERVLRARLSDAKYFWDLDCKTKLEERVGRLDQIAWNAKLKDVEPGITGSMGERVTRLQTLAAELSEYIPGCDRERARSAALLCKADLLTGMVGEFPELQGIMGRYYALAEGESADIANAIAEHYAPKGPDDRTPSAPVSVALALAEKIDTLFWMFAIGEKPTGSRDPFALRRAALGIIRLVLDNKLRLPLRRIFNLTDFAFAEGKVGVTWDRNRVVGEVLDFIGDRLKVHLKTDGVPHDQVAAVFALGDDDLVRVLERVRALGVFLKSDDGTNLLVAYRRAANILRIEEKKDSASYSGADYDPKLAEAEETVLWRGLSDAETALAAHLAAENFAQAMGALARLRRPVDAFFDKVTVNAPEANLRQNRLRLLARITSVMNRVADFSRLEG